MKLITFLQTHLKEKFSGKALKQAIDQKCCRVNGKAESFSSALLGAGDHVCFYPPAKKRTIAFDPQGVLFQDRHLLAYNKPPGVNCDEKGIEAIIKASFPSARLIHRLDRDTSGVLLLALDQDTFEAMVKQFREKEIHKHYYAIVDGIPTTASGHIENKLAKKGAYAGQTLWGSASDGLSAITDWQIEKRGRGVALVSCFPKTGRTHQLRVHLAEMGNPILGDDQYGKNFRSSYRPPRMLLHAYQLCIPYQKKELKIHAPLPADFLTAEKELF